jgi:hypothetical protein
MWRARFAPLSSAQSEVKMEESIGRSDTDIVWEHKMHIENIFYQRVNFFLLAESMLFVAFATVLQSRLIALLMITIGTSLTVIWLLVNTRHTSIYRHIRNFLEKECSVYKTIHDTRPQAAIGSWVMIAYLVPCLILAGWVTLFVVVLGTWVMDVLP